MTDQPLQVLLQQDPVLAQVYQLVIQHNSDPIVVTPKPAQEYFTALVSTIVGQQLSEKAADTIWNRLITHFPNSAVTPQAIIMLPPEKLREAGLSGAKTNYVRNLAETVLAGELDFSQLMNLSNDEVITQLTKVKGIGNWTAEMFLMFSLGKPDVFSLGDQGLKNAILRWYPHLHPLSPAAITALAAQWAPYRTYAAKILWRSLVLPK